MMYPPIRLLEPAMWLDNVTLHIGIDRNGYGWDISLRNLFREPIGDVRWHDQEITHLSNVTCVQASAAAVCGPNLCRPHGSKRWQKYESIPCNKHAYAVNLHTTFVVMTQDHTLEPIIVYLIGRHGEHLAAVVLFYVPFPTIGYPSG